MPEPEDHKQSKNILPFGPGSAAAGVAGGAGGPHDPGMEPRVTRLEEQFTRIEALLRGIDDRVRRLEIEGGELKGRIAHLPTTWAMVTTMIGGQIALAGILLAALRIVGAH